jgi:hypothetical protein
MSHCKDNTSCAAELKSCRIQFSPDELRLDAPVLMDTEGNIGQVWTRVLHYRYNCNADFLHCADEEQFYLANGYGEWQWKHYQNGTLVSSTLMNNEEAGSTDATLACPDSYEPRTAPKSTGESKP